MEHINNAILPQRPSNKDIMSVLELEYFGTYDNAGLAPKQFSSLKMILQDYLLYFERI